MKFWRLVATLVKYNILLGSQRRLAPFLLLAAVLTELFSLSYLGRFIDGVGASDALAGSYFRFAVLGTVALNFVVGFSGTAPQKLRENQLSGGLETLFLAPYGELQLMLALALSTLPISLLRLLIELSVATALGVGFSLSPIPLAIGVMGLLLAGLAWSLLGMAWVLWFKRGNLLSWLLGAGSLLLSGVWFPAQTLPPGLQRLGLLLPTTAPLAFLRQGLGAASVDFHPALGELLSVLGISWVIGLSALASALNLGKSRGDLYRY